MSLLRAEHLTVTPAGSARTLVDDVSFEISPGETLAVVGESGSGKTLTALSLLRLLPRTLELRAGSKVDYKGENLLTLPEPALQQLRGNRISMIFQEPMTALNPLHRLEKQIGEIITLHRNVRGPKLREEVKEALRGVGLGGLETRLNAFPHELSGGQRQRVMIAMAIANKPDLLIADEPTTALDVTVQQQILGLLRELQQKSGLALLLITHDLTLVRKMADRVAVMQRGKIVETKPTRELFAKPEHPYTQFLLAAEPKGRNANPVRHEKATLACDKLSVRYITKKSLFGFAQASFTAVENLSLNLHEGETLGVVGESGSGKTTLGMALLRLARSEGAITFEGTRVDTLDLKQIRPLRRRMQVVFQDPFASLNPRMMVGDIIAEGMRVHGLAATRAEEGRKVAALLQEVGMEEESARRYPHEFSGGQRQRISIARALAVEPALLLLDEPTSALDIATQAQILDLLKSIQARRALSMLFISHDLRVIRAIAHRVIVLKDGRIVEEADTETLVTQPREEYTRKLMEAAFVKEW